MAQNHYELNCMLFEEVVQNESFKSISVLFPLLVHFQKEGTGGGAILISDTWNTNCGTCLTCFCLFT